MSMWDDYEIADEIADDYEASSYSNSPARAHAGRDHLNTTDEYRDCLNTRRKYVCPACASLLIAAC